MCPARAPSPPQSTRWACRWPSLCRPSPTPPAASRSGWTLRRSGAPLHRRPHILHASQRHSAVQVLACNPLAMIRGGAAVTGTGAACKRPVCCLLLRPSSPNPLAARLSCPHPTILPHHLPPSLTLIPAPTIPHPLAAWRSQTAPAACACASPANGTASCTPQSSPSTRCPCCQVRRWGKEQRLMC